MLTATTAAVGPAAPAGCWSAGGRVCRKPSTAVASTSGRVSSKDQQRRERTLEVEHEEALTPRQRRLAQQKRKWEQQQERKRREQRTTHSQAALEFAAPQPQALEQASDAVPAPLPRGRVLVLQDKADAEASTQPYFGDAARNLLNGPPLPDDVWSVASPPPCDGAFERLRSASGSQLSQIALAWADEAGAVADATGVLPVACSANAKLLARVCGERLPAGGEASGGRAAGDGANSCGDGDDTHGSGSSGGGSSDASARRGGSARGDAACCSSEAHEPLSRQQLADAAWALRVLGASDTAVRLEAAMSVPFRVLPGALRGLNLVDFVAEVALCREVVYLDGGKRAVEESRLTAWQSDAGASFKYSGKEMAPGGPLSPSVAAVRDTVEALTGVHFDSVLINYYANGRCGMRFHADPTYGCWDDDAAVVSIGQTRRFVFREAADFGVRWEYRVHSGDVVHMFGDCQERLQHCIKVEREDRGRLGPRISLVFKRRSRDPQTGEYVSG